MIFNETKPLIDWLTYRSYEAQRINNPHIPDYRWRKLYSQAIEFEEIYNNYVKSSKKQGDNSYVY